MSHYLKNIPIGKPATANNPDAGHVYVFYDQDGNLYVKLSDGTIIGNNNGNLESINGSTYSTVQHLMNLSMSAGSIGDGFVTDGGLETINVAAGKGFIRIADDDVSTLKFFDWVAENGLSIPTDTVRYIGIEYNSGSPQVVIKSTNDFDYDTDFYIATVVNENSDLYIINDSWKTADAITNIIERIDGNFGLSRDSRTGGLILENIGTRNISISSGILLSKLSEILISDVDTSASDTFDAYYDNGSGGWIKQTGLTQWNNTNWDDGSGTLAALTAGYYTSRWIYVTASDDTVMVYGTAEYATLSEAIGDGEPNHPDRIDKLGLLIGRIIAREGTDTPGIVQTAFESSFSFASISNHNNLSGLQGGINGERNHLSDTEVTKLTNIETGATNNTKATSSELNTGTDDAKFATALALQNSKYTDQSSAKLSATASGTNTYTATIAPAITAYANTQVFFIKFTNGNTGASTINLNSLGAKSIVKNGSSALAIGDIAAGQVYALAYDGTNFQIIGRNTTPTTLIFGNQYQYASSDGASTTGSGTYQTKLSMVTGSLPSGTYRIGYTCEVNKDAISSSVEVLVQINGTTTIANPIKESKDTTDWVTFSGFYHGLLNGVQTITIQYRQVSGDIAGIRRARLEIWRVA